MPASAQPNIQILETKIRPYDSDASRVELTICDANDIESANNSVVISLLVKHRRKVPFLVDLQSDALHRAVDLIREHTRSLDEVIDNLRK